MVCFPIPLGMKLGNGADVYVVAGSRSFLPALSSVVQSGITVLIWAGDADSVCDWFGGFASVNAIDYDSSEEFQNTEVQNFTVNGTVKGMFFPTWEDWVRGYEKAS